MRKIAALIALVMAASIVSAFSYGSIPATRIPPGGWTDVQWSDPGGWTTLNVTTQGVPANTPSSDAGQKLMDLVAGLNSPTILYFPPGNYYINTTLEMNKGNIRLVGAGANQTKFYMTRNTRENRVTFRGLPSGSPITITANEAAGSFQITVANASTLNVGDLIRISQNYTQGTMTPNEGYGQMSQITAKSGNTLTLDIPLGLSYQTANIPLVQKYNKIENVGVESIYFERTQDIQEGNIIFDGVVNGYMTNIESYRGGAIHVAVRRSMDVVVENNLIHHAFGYGVGGYGYGIQLDSYATRNRISNNKLWELRHHIILDRGANRNVISYNYAGPNYRHDGGAADLDLHGNWAYGNLFEGNTGKQLISDGFYGQDGPLNTYYRNKMLENVEMRNGPNGATKQANIVGNELGTSIALHSTSTDNYVGANREAGVVNWGDLSSSAILPASLYTETKPAFLGTTAWPAFGPGVPNWGSSATGIIDNLHFGRLIYSGSWTHGSDVDYYDGSKSVAGTTAAPSNARASLTFTGSTIKMIVKKIPAGGRIDVYIDGIYDSTVDTYKATAESQAEVYAKSWTTSATRTIELRHASTKHASSSGYYIGLDYLEAS